MAQPEQQTTMPRVRHEDFCLKRPEYDAVRIEQYPIVGDDGEGHERTLIITRCLECGAARYDNPNDRKRDV